MERAGYEQLILERIKGLPPRALAEIADFVEFLRQRPQDRGPLPTTLADLSRDQEEHLEEEFRGYDKLYPRE